VSPLADAVPAASAALVRDGSDGVEALLLRRHGKASFGPGAWVFPGGRVDPGDAAPADGSDGAGETAAAESAELAAARRAAVRETAEEAGLVVDGTRLWPVSRWTPPSVAPLRFQTWILLGEAPAGEVVIDGAEIVDYQWRRPADALAARETGELDLMSPTWVTLWTLARQPSVAAALAAAAATGPELFETRIARVAGGALALWHGDAGYADGDLDVEGDRHRLWMVNSGWRYERTELPSAAGRRG
jgi:8-oxo-dGTP pyrophosphatase MutT (NUDIX family)